MLVSTFLFIFLQKSSVLLLFVYINATIILLFK
nr:MAG TPA: hypothetical protein [Crassvirales sp.]